MKQIKRKIIFSCILPCLSFANCLKEIFSHGPVSSWRKLKSEVDSICSRKEKQALDNFIFEVEILNPVSAEHTREHLNQKMIQSFNFEREKCVDKPIIDLGQCLTDYMLKRVGREIPKGLNPIHPKKAMKAHHAIGKMKNSQGQCSFTAISENVGITALHCFYPRIIPSEHFGQSMNDLLHKRSEVKLSLLSGESKKLKINDFLVFTNLSNLNFLEDDMVLIKFNKKKIFKHFLPIKSVEEIKQEQKFFMAGLPGVYNFDSFSMYERVANKIEMETNRIYSTMTTFKGDSGSSLRVQEKNQDFIVGVLFGSENKRTVFSAITKERKKIIDNFIDSTLTDEERSYQFEKLEL
ncbi:trypsin-like serine protease [Bacteriovoracaceae bacterium]|nr:trypsin-like serine protease [Bacteriovoracaceae bacterium]